MKPTRWRRTTKLQTTRPVILQLEQLEERSLLSANLSIAPLAVTGNTAPGAEGGQFTFDFELGALNNHGQVIFTADLDAGNGDEGEGVFLAGGGQAMAQIIRVGEPAPGGGTFGGFGSFSPDTINDRGDAAFAFGTDPFAFPVGTGAGVYRYDHSTHKVSAVMVAGTTPAPGGGIFQGAGFHPFLNLNGGLVFAGIVPSDIGPGADGGLGVGVFVADKQGNLSDVVRPGDPASCNSVVDFAQNPSLNNLGDVAFGAHINGEPRLGLGQDFPNVIFSAESVYYKDHSSGNIYSIAHQGAAIPYSAGGGTYDYAYSPIINDHGQILFDAGLMGTDSGAMSNGQEVDSQALFLYSGGQVISIARQGQAMPGGGHLVSASLNPGNYSLNNNGNVAFNAKLDNGQEGVFIWANGSMSLVAKTGTVIPGLGTIASMDQYGNGLPNAYVSLNDYKQVAFGAVLTDGRVALLFAKLGGGFNANAVTFGGSSPAGVTPAGLPGAQPTSSGSLVNAPALFAVSSPAGQSAVVLSGKGVLSSTDSSTNTQTPHTHAIDALFATTHDGLGDPFAGPF